MAYTDLVVPERAGKPRERGLTMAIDWGLGGGEQADLLAGAADYVDLAKVAVGISRLLPREVLERKIEGYRAGAVVPFPGGMLLEYAVHQGRAASYLAETAALGYPAVEVSDNVVKLEPARKSELIRRAAGEHGLVVLAETGSKTEVTPVGDLVRDALACLEAGAWKVFVEAAEFFDHGRLKRDLVAAIAREVPVERVIFELPGRWIAGIHGHEIHAMAVWLLEELGMDVNLGNVAPADVLALETLRTGLGVTMRAGAPG